MKFHTSKIITHNECSCLFSSGIEDENCLKRYFWVYDIKSNQYFKFAVCSEHLRLLIKKENIGRRFHPFLLDEIILNLLSNYIDLSYYEDQFLFQKNGNDLWDKKINVEIVRKPFINRYVSMEVAITECIENRDVIFLHEVIDEIIQYLDHVKYKKYKSKYKSCMILLKKFKKEIAPKNKQLIMNELLTNILTLNTK